MPKKYKQMSGEEFIQKFLNGERDFSRIALPEGCDLRLIEGYAALKENYQNPIILSNSRLFKLVAPEINLRASVTEGAVFEYADLRESKLSCASFSGSSFGYSCLLRANLESSKLEFANFYMANLMSANLDRANLWCASLHSANLHGACLREAYLVDADLRRANLTDADMHRSNFIDADLEGVNLTNAKNIYFSTGFVFSNFKNIEVDQANRRIIEELRSLGKDFKSPFL